MQKYVVLEKAVGETPLMSAEKWRAAHPQLEGVPLAYAGRLDPMASGKLLVLIGDECKQQTEYHGLDKEYEFSVLLGISSDTADVLGRLAAVEAVPIVSSEDLSLVAKKLIGDIALPYPHFSSKTVQGKPLHTWTLEGRLDEIEIPTASSTVYSLELVDLETVTRSDAVTTALAKIDTIPPVTDERKALGNDFRRIDVRADWNEVRENDALPKKYQIVTFRCVASSGTYMRSLSEVIASEVGTKGLAWHIHRTEIGRFNPEDSSWKETFN